jgi:hypothetical protein
MLQISNKFKYQPVEFFTGLKFSENDQKTALICKIFYTVNKKILSCTPSEIKEKRQMAIIFLFNY